jgi:outer membrane protein TolC
MYSSSDSVIFSSSPTTAFGILAVVGDDEKITLSEEEYIGIPLREITLTATIAKIGDYLVADPILDEEAVADTLITFSLDGKGNITGIQKSGNGYLTSDEVRKALAGILPGIKGSYSYSRLDDSLVFGFGLRDRQEYSITLSQTIFNKAIFESISFAKKQKELQKLILEDVKREIIYRVKEMYYALLYKRLVKELKEDNLKYWEENLKIVEEKYKAGILPKVEYMRAKAQYEMAKAQLEETKADYEKSLEEFKAFLKIEDNVEPSGRLNLKFSHKFPKEEELMRALLENNSTLKVARARVEVVEKAYGLAKSDYYPSVDAFLSYEGFTTRRTLFGGKEWVKGYVFGISVNYKFFDGFSREANIAQKKLVILKEKEKLKDTLFTLKKELKNALLTLKSLKVRIKAVKISL